MRWLRSSGVARAVLQRLAGLAALVAFGLVLARGSLTLAFALVAGAAGAILLLRMPALGLCVLAIAIPFGSLRTISVAGFSLSPSQPILAATIAAAVLRILANRQTPRLRSPILGTTLALLGVLSLSLLKAQDLSAALSELLKWIEVAVLLAYVAGCTTEQERHWIVAALLLAGAAEGVLGMYQFVFQVGPPGFVLFGRYMRAAGTFAQPNPYGGYLGLLLPLAFAIVALGWTRPAPSGGGLLLGQRALWLLALFALGAMAAGLIMSWSRGALLGAVAGMGLVLLGLLRRGWPLLAVLLIVLLLVGPALQPFLPVDLLSRLDDTATYLGTDLTQVEIDDANFAVIERLAHWQAAWRMFTSSPWLGVGVGQYPVVYPSVSIPRWQDPLGHAHNYYLNMAAEAGLAGLTAYLVWMGTAFVIAWRGTRREERWPRILALGALGMLGHLALHSLVDNLYVHDMYLVVAILLGMLQTGAPPAAGQPTAVLSLEQGAPEMDPL